MKYSIKGIIDNPEEADNFRNLLQYIYGISDLEAKIVELLLSPGNAIFVEEGTCIGYLSKTMDKDRSLIQRCLSKLMKQGIVTRTKLPLKEWISMCESLDDHDPHLHGTSSKGYLYIYKAVPKEDIKRKLMEMHSQGFDLINSHIEQL